MCHSRGAPFLVFHPKVGKSSPRQLKIPAELGKDQARPPSSISTLGTLLTAILSAKTCDPPSASPNTKVGGHGNSFWSALDKDRWVWPNLTSRSSAGQNLFCGIHHGKITPIFVSKIGARACPLKDAFLKFHGRDFRHLHLCAPLSSQSVSLYTR